MKNKIITVLLLVATVLCTSCKAESPVTSSGEEVANSSTESIVTDSNAEESKPEKEVEIRFTDPDAQKRYDKLQPFDPEKLPVFDGNTLEGSAIQHFTSFKFSEKTYGEDYLFTLKCPMAKSSDTPDGYALSYDFGLIITKNGKVLDSDFMTAASYVAVGAVTIPLDDDFEGMLKVYTMNQNGREFPLAVVTINIFEKGEIKETRSRFFSMKNDLGFTFLELTDYKNLPKDFTIEGNTIIDNVNGKKLIFDYSQLHCRKEDI